MARLVQTDWGSALCVAVLAPLLKVARKTWTVHWHIHPETQAWLDAGKPVVFAMHHGQIASVLKGFPGPEVSILSSISRDGDVIVEVLRRLGFQHPIRGGRKRRGAVAMLEMMEAIQTHGRSILIVVDGPKGPTFVAQPGAVVLASKTQVPIIPVVSVFTRPFWIFEQSWDRFIAPNFFSHIHTQLAEPLWVPSVLEDDETVRLLRKNLGLRLQALTDELTKQVGCSK